ncbi:MAG TPA: hypothetical protein VEV65_13980 [Kineosporiaceae bacterium]|nr:hypothetical protein [Kineosporiaceae bacterium]
MTARPPDDPNARPACETAEPGGDAVGESAGATTTRGGPATTSTVDPEDWASTRADDDERYQRERPPHWE